MNPLNPCPFILTFLVAVTIAGSIQCSAAEEIAFRSEIDSFYEDLSEDLKKSTTHWSIKGRKAGIEDYIGDLEETTTDLYVLDPGRQKVYSRGTFDSPALHKSIDASTDVIQETLTRRARIFGNIIDHYDSNPNLSGRRLFVIDHLLHRIALAVCQGLGIPDLSLPADADPPTFRLLRSEFLPTPRMGGDLNFSGPFPARWLNYDNLPRNSRELGRWVSSRTPYRSRQQADDPLAVNIRGPQLTEGALTWLESVEKRGSHLMLTVGHTGRQISREFKSKDKPHPFFLVHLGSFKTGKYMLRVRFQPFQVPLDAARDERNRPIGRSIAQDPRAALPKLARTRIVDIDPAEKPPLPPALTNEELQRRVDAANIIYIAERPSDERPMATLSILKGPGNSTRNSPPGTVRKVLQALPADHRTMIVFDPLSDDMPPIPATAGLASRIRKLVRVPREWIKVGDSWSFGIRARESSVKIGEPVEIEIATRNTTGAAQTKLGLSFSRHAHYPMAVFEVTDPAGKKHQLRCLTTKFRHGYFPSENHVAAGEMTVELALLDQWRSTAKPDESVFSRKGEYRIRCLLDPKRIPKLEKERKRYLDH